MVLGDDVCPGHTVRTWDGVIQAHRLNAPGLLVLLMPDCTPHGSAGDGGKLIAVKVRAGEPPFHGQQIAEDGNVEVFIHREAPMSDVPLYKPVMLLGYAPFRRRQGLSLIHISEPTRH